jgi:hypothetical protein
MMVRMIVVAVMTIVFFVFLQPSMYLNIHFIYLFDSFSQVAVPAGIGLVFF